jgi:hypothetical protein
MLFSKVNSVAEAIHKVPSFIPPGTHYCKVIRGNVDTKLAQGLYTLPVPEIEPQTR